VNTVILLYHRVATPATDPFGLAVPPDLFSAQVEHLAGLGCVVPLAEVRQPSRSPRIAVTFDDGYADNVEVAAPLLAHAGLPVTWFITAGKLDGQRFWWDRLSHALLGPHELPGGIDIDLAGGRVWLDLRSREARERALIFVHHKIRPLPVHEIESAITAVVAVLGAPPPPIDSLTMTRTQLHALAAIPGSEIGAHTLTHAQLLGQRDELKREEIVGSVERLQSLVQRPITSFAYPFGSPRAVDRAAQRLVREAGCELACSTDRGVVERRRRQFLLPRYAVGSMSMAEFTTMLSTITGM
jgi:peptidoglycan/xylan/chitin deacetylase (PgdA/CDA1 family)